MKLLLIGDDPLVRHGLRMRLARKRDITIERVLAPMRVRASATLHDAFMTLS